MHLIALLSHHPGLGDLQHQAPLELMHLLNSEHLLTFPDPIAEIAAVLTAQQNRVYANPTALSRDLAWLDANGFLGPNTTSQPLKIPAATPTAYPYCHPYSDREAFQRLMGTIRYILQHPLTQEPIAKELRDSHSKPSATSKSEPKHRDCLQQVNILAQQLQSAGIVPGDPLPMLRKDIERILKPYRIFPEAHLRKGYYLGTGILSQSELLSLYEISKKYANSADDLLAKVSVQRLEQRLGWAQIDCEHPYPVRSVAKSSIVNPNLLSPEALISEAQSQALETDIRQGNLVRICRRKGVASHGGVLPEEEILPLQMFFFNIAWYLGYQVVSGERAQLFCFERLDRLFRGPSPGQQRPRKLQKQALTQLETLFEHSFGLYLGKEASQQQAFLTATPSQRQKMMLTLDLRFTASLFSFISEGTQRFPLAQVQMSPPPDRDLHSLDPGLKAKLFCLKLDRKQHPEHPYQMRLKLPPWCFADITLKAWILGMGPEVKVLAPQPFQAWILRELQAAQGLY